MENLTAKLSLTVLSVGAISLGLMALFDIDVFVKFLPEYAKYLKIGIGALGAWMLYGLYKK